MTLTSAFKTPQGEAAYLAAYDAAMELWPVPYQEIEVPGRFGITHVVASGPEDAPPLVLLHGFMTNATMWVPSVADFARDYQVYAIDVLGQPGKSVPNPDQPIRDAADYVAWLGETLDGLDLDRISLVGMSYGGWLALSFCLAAPERVGKLVLLSPAASLQPIVKQMGLRVMLMVLLPTHLTVNLLFGWMGFKGTPGDTVVRCVLDQAYLGLQHFRMPPESSQIMPSVFSDNDLRALHVPVLLLIGENEVIYDAAKALDRARALLPNLEGELVPQSSHEMCSSQYQTVDERVLDFLSDN